VNQRPPAHLEGRKDGWMDGSMDDKWSGNSFLSCSSSLFNHGGWWLVQLIFFLTT
jgi:hypothetical protein